MINKSKLNNPDIQREKNRIEESLSDLELESNKINEYLKSEVDYLEAAIWRLKDMEEHNKFIHEMKLDEEINIDESKDQYNQEDLSVMNKEIDEINKNIKNIKSFISANDSLKADFHELVARFNELENDFKKTLLTLRSEQNQ